MSVRELNDMLLVSTKMERKPETEQLRIHSDQGVEVVEINTYPQAPDGAVRSDVHFMLVGLTEGAPDEDRFREVVRGALGGGEFYAMTAEELAGGPSYITLGGWLGSQDLALRFIGATELILGARAITPASLGIVDKTAADAMAGNGFVMLGVGARWS